MGVLTKSKGKMINQIRVLVIAILALIYLLGTIEIQSVHSILHNTVDEVELHSAANELNSCHQSVYHNQKEKNCEHKSHFVEVKKCLLCQLTMQSFHLIVLKNPVLFPLVTKVSEGGDYVLPLMDLQCLLTSRAPPSA